MPWVTPSLADLVTRCRNALNSAIRGADAFIPVNNLSPTSKAVASQNYELFLRLEYVVKQAFALFAEGEWLDAHASENGVAPRKSASPATGLVRITTDDALDVPEGCWLQRSDGATYAVTAAASIGAAGVLTVSVLAVAAGVASNASAGTELSFVAGAGGQYPTGDGAATATAEVDTAGIAQGADVEQDGPERTSDLRYLRGRVLWRKRNPPAGGSAADYVDWASAVAGVTRVFVRRAVNGDGTVLVYPMFDDLFASAGGIADAAHIQAVTNELALFQPSAATVVVNAPLAQVLTVTVSNLSPNTAAVQSAVLASLRDAFRRFGRVSGVDYPVPGLDYLAAPFTMNFGWIDRAVQDADGVYSADVTVNSARADIVISTGHVPVLSLGFA